MDLHTVNIYRNIWSWNWHDTLTCHHRVMECIHSHNVKRYITFGKKTYDTLIFYSRKCTWWADNLCWMGDIRAWCVARVTIALASSLQETRSQYIWSPNINNINSHSGVEEGRGGGGGGVRVCRGRSGSEGLGGWWIFFFFFFLGGGG